MAKKIKKASETTLIKVIVNFKCLGYAGKVLRSFTPSERGAVYDELIARGWMDEHLNVLPASQDIVTKNLHLCDK